MLVFGGHYDNLWKYKPGEVGSWEQVEPSGSAPSARYGHTAVWTGVWSGEMLVFGGGGRYGRYGDLNDFWAYKASGWVQLHPSGSAPSPRHGHTAVWAGNAMLVFGGYDSLHGDYFNDLWKYSPGNVGSWEQLEPSGSAPSTRYGHTAVWAGEVMLVFGGFRSGVGDLSDLWKYTPGEVGSWEQLEPSGSAPSARYGHTAVWAGEVMLVFGGFRSGVGDLSDLWKYTPGEVGSWEQLEPGPEQYGQTAVAVWAGAAMLVLGGDLWKYSESGEEMLGTTTIVLISLLSVILLVALVIARMWIAMCRNKLAQAGANVDLAFGGAVAVPVVVGVVVAEAGSAPVDLTPQNPSDEIA